MKYTLARSLEDFDKKFANYGEHIDKPAIFPCYVYIYFDDGFPIMEYLTVEKLKEMIFLADN